MQPKLFIAMASRKLGGPGKGLVQFFNHGGLSSIQPVMVGYDRFPGQESEFDNIFPRMGINLTLIRQKYAIDFWMINQGLAIVRNEKCNILQSHGYKSHILCALLHLKTGIPWIAFVHGWTDEGYKMRIYNVIEKLIVQAATRVVAVSDFLKQCLPALAQHKTIVIQNAVDPAELDESSTGADVRTGLGIPSDALVVGVVGRLSPEKGQVYFLRALAIVRRAVPRVVGLLVGDGQDRKMLESETQQLGLAGSVYFAGHVDHVGDYYRSMDVSALPSLSEGMPNAVLEAMLFQKPVVASRVGGVPEVVVEGETGFMVNPADPDALADALLRILADPEKFRFMGEKAKQRILNEFSPSTRTKKILALYEEILATNQM